MKWIFKGRTVVSDDGRWRIAHVVRGWDVLDQGRVIATGCQTAQQGINEVANALRLERRRQEHTA